MFLNLFILMLKILLVAAIIFTVTVVFPMLYWAFYYFKIKGMKFKKGYYQYVGHGSVWRKLFIDFPKRFVLDWINRDPDMFPEYGVHIIEGEQGNGKSVTATYIMNRYKKMYPKLVIRTNYGYKYENYELTHWQDFLATDNDIYGEIIMIDEIQTWFSSNTSKDFPLEVLNDVTQLRKQRKMILGTSQVFNRVGKPLREQCYKLYTPRTYFGCLTFVVVTKPQLDENGVVKESKKIESFFFVHDDFLRDSFDTYKRIKSLFKVGFSQKAS